MPSKSGDARFLHVQVLGDEDGDIRFHRRKFGIEPSLGFGNADADTLSPSRIFRTLEPAATTVPDPSHSRMQGNPRSPSIQSAILAFRCAASPTLTLAVWTRMRISWGIRRRTPHLLDVEGMRAPSWK